MSRACSTHGAIQKCPVLLKDPKEIDLYGDRSIRRWEDNIKMDLREVSCDAGDWINLAQDGVQWRACVMAAMNFRVL